MSRAIFISLLLTATSCIKAQNINRQNISCPMGINVNSYTGNLYLERNDLYIEGRKLPIDLTFYYNSVLDTFNLGFGRGWTMQYFMQYETTLKGIRIRRADGFAMDYDQVAAADYKAPAGVFDVLVKYALSPVKFLLTDKYGTGYYFDDPVSKRLTQIKEINGNYLNFSYANGMLVQITDAAGRSVQLDYGANGLLNKITDAITQPVRELKYSYDGYGNLIQVEDPLGQKLTYDYIINGPVRRLADKNGNIADIIYNSAYNVKEVITCNTNQRFSYDKTNGITLMAEQVSGKNQTTTYRYNSIGYITHKQGNCCGFDNSFEYDDNGNAVKFTDANGHVSTFTYDSRGNMLSKQTLLEKP